jgi:hypothetical protein
MPSGTRIQLPIRCQVIFMMADFEIALNIKKQVKI